MNQDSPKRHRKHTPLVLASVKRIARTMKRARKFRKRMRAGSIYEPERVFVIDKSAVPERIFHERDEIAGARKANCSGLESRKILRGITGANNLFPAFPRRFPLSAFCRRLITRIRSSSFLTSGIVVELLSRGRPGCECLPAQSRSDGVGDGPSSASCIGAEAPRTFSSRSLKTNSTHSSHS